MSAFAVERELQHLHPGEVQVLAELADVGRDDAQVLGDERQAAQRLAGGPEEVLAGPGDPLALAGRGGAGRDVPGGGEAAEVVEADEVHVVQQGAQPVDPPAVTRPARGPPSRRAGCPRAGPRG